MNTTKTLWVKSGSFYGSSTVAEWPVPVSCWGTLSPVYHPSVAPSKLWSADTDTVIHTPVRNTQIDISQCGVEGREDFFSFPFLPHCQCVTWGPNTVTGGTFSFGCVNSKRRITSTHAAFDCSRCCSSKNDQSNKGVSSPLLHFHHSLSAGPESSGWSAAVSGLTCFSARFETHAAPHTRQKLCWSSPELSSFLIFSRPLPLGPATSVEHLSYNAGHAVAAANRTVCYCHCKLSCL